MNELKTDIPFFDAVTISYECPRCGHPQKQKFAFQKVGDELKFKCKKCNFENSVTLSEIQQ